MKIKTTLIGLIALSAITVTNYLLWHNEVKSKEVDKKENEVVIGKDKSIVDISDEFEYPAPMKQLQQVIVKSYQAPSHEGEEIFPKKLIPAEEDYQNDYEDKERIEGLRERIEKL